MSYGLQIRTAQNKIVYDTTSITWFLVEQFNVGRNQTATKNYSGLNGFINIGVQIELLEDLPTNSKGYIPIYTVNFSPSTGALTVSVGPDLNYTDGPALASMITVLAQ